MTRSEPVGEAVAVNGGEIVRDGLVTFVCRVLSLVAALGLSVATARYLGPEGRGIFALPTIDAAIATSAFAGLSAAMSFLLLNERGGLGAIRAVVLAAIPFLAIGALLVVALGVLGGHTWATVFALASLPFAAMLVIAQGLCYGARRVRLANYLGMSLAVVSLIGTLVGFILIARNPFVAIGAWLVSQALVGLASCVVIVRFCRLLPQSPAPNCNALRYAAKMGAVNLVTLLNYRADVYIVALFTSPAMLGMYTLAVAGAEATQTATQAVATTTAPHVGSLPEDRSRVFTARAARNNIALATVACAIIAVASPLLIETLFGARFLTIVGPLRILLVGIVATSASGVLANYFNLALGRPEQSLYVAGFGAATSIGLSMFLVPRIGLYGAALSVSTSYVCSAAAYIVLFMRATDIPLRDIVLLYGSDLRAYGGLANRTILRFRRFMAIAERL